MCRLSCLVMPPHQRLRLVASRGDFSVARGAVGWHTGIAASSASTQREIFTITDFRRRPPPPTQLNEVALGPLMRES